MACASTTKVIEAYREMAAHKLRRAYGHVTNFGDKISVSAAPAYQSAFLKSISIRKMYSRLFGGVFDDER